MIFSFNPQSVNASLVKILKPSSKYYNTEDKQQHLNFNGMVKLTTTPFLQTKALLMRGSPKHMLFEII